MGTPERARRDQSWAYSRLKAGRERGTIEADPRVSEFILIFLNLAARSPRGGSGQTKTLSEDYGFEGSVPEQASQGLRKRERPSPDSGQERVTRDHEGGL